MINNLVDRIVEARGKQKLEALLKTAKSRVTDRRLEFKTTGTPDELRVAAQAAISDGVLTEAEIQNLVDTLEENGGQHIFLFTVTELGRKALTPQVFFRHFAPQEADGFYARYPTQKQTRYEDRNGTVVVKQVFTTQFWKLNDTTETATRRTLVYDRVRRRSINLLRYDPRSGEVDIRIDHVHGKDDLLAEKMLRDFLMDLVRVVDLEEHLVPVDVSRGFAGIVAARDETFMSVDEAFDYSASMRFAKRRQDNRGADIRDHGRYAKAVVGGEVGRETLRVYWLVGQGEQQRRIHTIISTMDCEAKVGLLTLGKAYVPAKVDASDLDHALARIRHFAS